MARDLPKKYRLLVHYFESRSCFAAIDPGRAGHVALEIRGVTNGDPFSACEAREGDDTNHFCNPQQFATFYVSLFARSNLPDNRRSARWYAKLCTPFLLYFCSHRPSFQSKADTDRIYATHRVVTYHKEVRKDKIQSVLDELKEIVLKSNFREELIATNREYDYDIGGGRPSLLTYSISSNAIRDDHLRLGYKYLKLCGGRNHNCVSIVTQLLRAGGVETRPGILYSMCIGSTMALFSVGFGVGVMYGLDMVFSVSGIDDDFNPYQDSRALTALAGTLGWALMSCCAYNAWRGLRRIPDKFTFVGEGNRNCCSRGMRRCLRGYLGPMMLALISVVFMALTIVYRVSVLEPLRDSSGLDAADISVALFALASVLCVCLSCVCFCWSDSSFGVLRPSGLNRSLKLMQRSTLRSSLEGDRSDVAYFVPAYSFQLAVASVPGSAPAGLDPEAAAASGSGGGGGASPASDLGGGGGGASPASGSVGGGVALPTKGGDVELVSQGK